MEEDGIRSRVRGISLFKSTKSMFIMQQQYLFVRFGG